MSNEKWLAVLWTVIHVASLFNQEVHLVATTHAIFGSLRVLCR